MKRQYKKPLIASIAVQSMVIAASGLQRTNERANQDYEVLSKKYDGGLWYDTEEE